jgi:hypothetical protein
MQLEPNQTVVLTVTRWALCVLISLAGLTALASGKRIRLIPELTTGALLRYRIESTTTTSGNTTTPIINPEGATRSLLTIHMLLRLDVLSAPADANPGPVHLRATYEQSEAESQSDAFDPGQPSISDQYAHLQGRSIDFTLDPSGKIADAKGLEQDAVDRSAAQSTRTLLNGLIPSSELPDGGVEIGQKWKSEKPMAGAPFSDLVWRFESTYLRDEPCPQAVASVTPGQGAAESGACAVILTTFTISRRSSSHSDATPDDYARNGLRVSGTWTGSGETLDSVSLATGILIRSTQTMDQQADYNIISTANGSKVHQQSHVQSQSETVLEPAAAFQQ